MGLPWSRASGARRGGPLLPKLSLAGHPADAVLRSAAPDAGTSVGCSADEESRRSTLLSAVQCGHVAVVSTLLERGGDANATYDSEGRKLLHLATWCGQAAVAGLLLERGADANAGDSYGDTPLLLAARHGHASLAGLLLKSGANVNAKTSKGSTPLFFASQYGHTDVVALLLEHGADYNAKAGMNYTPLHIAAERGHTAVVKRLLQGGANVNAKADGGLTPLLVAAYSGHESIVTLLLERGADLNAAAVNGFTPLLVAAKEGHASLVTLLLENTDLDADENALRNILHFGAANGRASVVRLALERGVDVDDAQLDIMRTPLHQAAVWDHASAAALLLDHGANIHAADYAGFTPLHLAALNGSLATTQLLLERNANINARAFDNNMALHVAAFAGHAHVVALLLEHHGVDINAKASRYGFTSLHLAALRGHPPVVTLLLERGADINGGTDRGFTPMDLVVMGLHTNGDPPEGPLRHKLECMQILFQSGAIISAQTNGTGLANRASQAVAHSCRDLVFMLLWRGVHVKVSKGDSDAVLADDSATAVSDKLVVDSMLAEWQRGGLRVWRSGVHSLFPAAFRTDTCALLLATLGSLDAAAAVDEDCGSSAEPGADNYSRRIEQRLRNPLRMLHERRLLDAVIQALLHTHMYGPPAPPRATA